MIWNISSTAGIASDDMEHQQYRWDSLR